MIWKKYLDKNALELAKYLEKDIQYCYMAKKRIRQIAWRETEIFIQDYKKWAPKDIILNGNTTINNRDREKINKFIQKRKKGIPLAYILGKQEFYGLEFKVNQSTLIPRPETEELVEYVLNFVETNLKPIPTKKIILIDIGTGSGCIITAILKNLSRNTKFSEIYAVDKSRKALDIAEKNIRKHLGGLEKIKFIQGSLLDFFVGTELCPVRTKQNSVPIKMIITDNLPYLSEKEYQNLSPEVKKHEPREALDGGKHGHELICQLIAQLLSIYRNAPRRVPTWDLFLEISPTIYPAIKKYCAIQDLPIKIRKKADLSKHIRMLHISC